MAGTPEWVEKCSDNRVKRDPTPNGIRRRTCLYMNLNARIAVITPNFSFLEQMINPAASPAAASAWSSRYLSLRPCQGLSKIPCRDSRIPRAADPLRAKPKGAQGQAAAAASTFNSCAACRDTWAAPEYNYFLDIFTGFLNKEGEFRSLVKRDNRESGLTPERARRCDWGRTLHNVTVHVMDGKAQSVD
jgi:hypothetical protein